MRVRQACETLEFETKASDHISNGSCTGTVVWAEKTTIKLAKIAWTSTVRTRNADASALFGGWPVSRKAR